MNDPRELFQWLLQHVPTAEEPIARSIQIAHRRIALGCFDAELATHLLSPFSHLQSPSEEEAELDIVAWKEAFCDDAPARLDLPRPFSLRTISSDGRYALCLSHESIQVLDRSDDVILAAFRELAPIESVQRVKPFVFPLSVWLNDNAVLVCHAAMVAREDIGILLVGAGGAGKSTSAYACTNAGMDFLGDDKIAVEEVAGEWVGHSLYGTLRRKNSQPKEIVDVAKDFSGQARRSCPIRGIVIPQFVPGMAHARLREASSADAFRALAPSNLTMSSTVARSAMPLLSEMARSLPCFTLTSGNEADIAAHVAQAMGQLRA